MDNIESILMPVDAGRNAWVVAGKVTNLADRIGAELHVLDLARESAESEHDEVLRGLPASAFRRDVIAYRPQVVDGSIRSVIQRADEPADAILKYAHDHKIGCIVMAPYGQYHGERYVVDAVAEQILRSAPCDVLTAGFRSLSRPDSFRRILVPVDFSRLSAYALARARLLAKQTRAHLTMLHVLEISVTQDEHRDMEDRGAREYREAYEALELFYRECEGPEVPHHFWVMTGRPASRIVKYAERRADLIVMPAEHPGPAGQRRIDPTIDAVVRHAPCMVLTVKAPANLESAIGAATRDERDDPRKAEPTNAPRSLRDESRNQPPGGHSPAVAPHRVATSIEVHE